MLIKIAQDKDFRDLVRSIAAYITDQDEWEEEVEKVFKRSIPKSDQKKAREEILRRNPGVNSLSEYFDQIGPKDPKKLSEMIKSIYWGIFDPNRNITDIPRDKSIQIPPPQRSMKDQLKKFKELFPTLASSTYKKVSGHMCLNIINRYLDSFEI